MGARAKKEDDDMMNAPGVRMGEGGSNLAEKDSEHLES